MRTKEGNKEKDILEAAIKVFAISGYYNAKISKIAEVAGVATGSVYIYFKNKENILQKIFDNLWKSLYEELNNLIRNDVLSPIEKIDAMIDLVFDNFTKNPSSALVFVNEQNQLLRESLENFTIYYTKFMDLGEQLFQEGVDNGAVSPNVDIKMFRYFILGGLRNLLQNWAENPESFPLNKIRQNVKYLIKYGIINK